mgnify:CR=1 FL=1
MYQGNNPSALRSREEIVNAFMTLLQHSSIDRITIKQIMDTAGLSRQTFYQIFFFQRRNPGILSGYCIWKIYRSLQDKHGS